MYTPLPPSTPPPLPIHTQQGCIPVVLGDAGVLPFFEVLDWDRASVRVWPYDLDHITERLRGIPQQLVTEMKEQVCVL